MTESQLRLDVLAFMREAGALAIRNQLLISRQKKADNTLVTDTDLAITQLCKDHFASYFNTPNHILVDEESIGGIGAPSEVMDKAQYIWVLDPIDGTVPYAAGRSGYAISLGILKDGKPWFGAMYYPSFGELLYGDCNEAFAVTKAFAPTQQRRPLQAGSMVPDPSSLFEIGSSVLLKYTLKNLHIGIPSVPHATTVSLYHVLTEKSVGYICYANLWDVAAAWPLAIAVGLEGKSYLEGRLMDAFHLDMWTDDWKMTDEIIFSKPEHYEEIRDVLVLNPKFKGGKR